MEQKSVMTVSEKNSLLKSMVTRILFIPVFIWLFSILPAGSYRYWHVYVYFAVLLIPMVYILFYFLRYDPRFLLRRTRILEKEKNQTTLQLLFLIFFLLIFIIPALDFRYNWSSVPVYLVLVADIVVFIGYMIVFAVFRQNSYASRIIEVEQDQKVISTGLYAIVRHPMYLGVLVMFLPTSIALGSYWGTFCILLVPVVLVLRIISEERFLRKSLPGYVEYCQKVRYRLIPYIW